MFSVEVYCYIFGSALMFGIIARRFTKRYILFGLFVVYRLLLRVRCLLSVLFTEHSCFVSHAKDLVESSFSF